MPLVRHIDEIHHHDAADIDTGIAPQGAHRLDGPYRYLDRQRGGLDGFFHPELYRLVNADALALRQLRDGGLEQQTVHFLDGGVLGNGGRLVFWHKSILLQKFNGPRRYSGRYCPF